MLVLGCGASKLTEWQLTSFLSRSILNCCVSCVCFPSEKYCIGKGGGARERIFWKNYFFHCAYTRYEAGLSIDEIWSNLSEEERSTAPVPTETSISGTTTNVASAFGTQQVHLESTNAAAHLNRNNDNVDETITFESGDEQVVRPDVSSQLFRQEENASTDPGRTATSSALAQSESDYELVGDGVGSTSNTHGRIDGAEDDVSPLDDADYELDELEAEIARELED